MNDTSATDSVAPPDQSALVRRAQDGDLGAFNVLVELHQRLVFNLCLRMLGSNAPAEDATQDAFIAAYRKISTFRGESFRAWLMRIAANTCTDQIRRRSRRRSVSLDVPASETSDRPLDIADARAGPEEEAERGEQRRSIEAALLKLPTDQRLAVIMCDVQGFSYEEIAEATSASIGTVKSRIARGREKLRRELSRTGTTDAAGTS